MPALTLPVLTLRDRHDDDLPTLWRWLHAESDPEWERWDAPYFHADSGPSTLSLTDFTAREYRRAPDPHGRIIALDGACIGQATRHEEAPAGGG